MSPFVAPVERPATKMSENEIADRLASLMKEQQELRLRSDHKDVARELDSLRNQCIELMEQYFRYTVYPMIAARFPGKIGPDRSLAQFTQLLADFFVEIKEKYDDPIWIKTTPAQLRGYASTAISNDIRDLWGRNTKGREVAAVHALKQTIARDAADRMAQDQLNLQQVLAVLERWDQSGDSKLKQYARVIRLYYIVELTDEEVDRDMMTLTLQEIAEQAEISVATAGRYRLQALAALREELVSDQQEA